MLAGKIREMVREVTSQRDEILKAFVAKHGFEPDSAIQIEERQPDGVVHWYVRKMTDAEKAKIAEGKATGQN